MWVDLRNNIQLRMLKSVVTNLTYTKASEILNLKFYSKCCTFFFFVFAVFFYRTSRASQFFHHDHCKTKHAKMAFGGLGSLVILSITYCVLSHVACCVDY